MPRSTFPLIAMAHPSYDNQGQAIEIDTVLREESYDNALTAVGTAQTTGLQLTGQMNRITTAAASSPTYNGVVLPGSQPGMNIVIINSAANPIQVYGLGTDTVNAAASGTGITQVANSAVMYFCAVGGLWHTMALNLAFSSSTPVFSNGLTVSGANMTITDVDVALSATTGTKIGTATTQKLAFYNTTPIVQPANTVDYVTMLTNLGLRATGGTASATFLGQVLSTLGAAGGVGYATGAGGTVTQATSKSTGVTLNTPTGTITMNNAALNTVTSVAFTLTNSVIAATDVIIVNFKSANTANSYFVSVDAVAAGSCSISVRNYTGGNLSEAIVLSFAIIKGVAA